MGSAVLLTPPYLQFLDAAGAPLNGGLVYTYAAGTSTPLATFTDASGNTQAANPVVLDSAGRTTIWIQGAYKFVVTDALGNVIRTTDNVTAFNIPAASANTFFQSFSGDGSTVAFTLSSDLGTDENAVIVFVDNGGSSAITNTPAFQGFTVTAAQVAFTLANAIPSNDVKQIRVYANTTTKGFEPLKADGVDYTLSGTTLTLASTPSVTGANCLLVFQPTLLSGNTGLAKGYEVQNPNAFTLTSGGTPAITFASAPAVGTNNIFVFAPSLILGAASASANQAATYATNAAASATLAQQWATLITGQVAATDYSSKAYAIGGTGVTGAAGASKEWATKVSATVDGTLFSAKEYSQGTQAATGGSAKNWAQQVGADVTGAAANSRSAKSWAQDVNTGATLGGSAKDWAKTTGGTVDGTEYAAKEYAQGTTVTTGSAKDWASKTSAIVGSTDYSAKEFAQGSQASTGGSSKNWAQQTGADVTGAAANSRSAKSWAQDANTGATLGGSSKDWAQNTSVAVDGTTYSSKEFSQGTQAGTGGSSKNWAQQTGADVTGAVAGSRSAKSWAQENIAGVTYGGSSKDWAQSASLPDGVNKSAKSYATDASTSATASAASATSASNSAVAAAAAAVGLANEWLFATSILMTDPGTGNFRIDNAVFGLVSNLAISALSGDSGNPNLRTFIQTWDDSTHSPRGIIRIEKNATNFIILGVNGALTDNTTWLQIPVTLIASAGSFSAADVTFIGFTPYGNDGTGSGTVTTTGSPANGNLAKFTGSTSVSNGDLSGDVTTSGTLSTTIANNAVSYTKFRQIAANAIVGNPTGSLANGQDITLGAAFTFSGTALQTIAFTGDITTPANSVATTIAPGAVTASKMSAPASVNNAGTAGGSANALTLTPTPALAAYAAGDLRTFIAASSNTSKTVTVAVSGLATRNIKKFIGGAIVLLAVGDIIANMPIEILDDGTQYILMNPQTYTQGSNIASAGTVNLDTAEGDYVHVTGTTTITAITLSQGRQCEVVFDGILTLTNGASLILPTNANLTTAAGDVAVFRGEASGVVRCTYFKADGTSAAIANVQTFTATGAGTWNKPTNGTMALIQCWGAGGSGGSSTSTSNRGGGGGGGSYTEVWIPLALLGSTETATVGTGGAGVATSTAGNAGTNSTFGSWATGYGGGAGGGNSVAGGGGGAGSGVAGNNGAVGANATTTGGANGGASTPALSANTMMGGGAGGTPGGDGFYGGGGGCSGSPATPTAGQSIWGGGGGGGASGTSGTTGMTGGASQRGGGGGGAAAGTGSVGARTVATAGGYGGKGGNNTTAGEAGQQPGGGGGGGANSNSSGKGGDGKIVVIVV